MEVIKTVADWRASLDAERYAGRSVGLVPTMGFLHEGHASLIRRATAECDVVGVTVFVNPLQFAPHEDLATYPRDLPRDVAMAQASGAHYVFAPSVDEMYPQRVVTVVSVPQLTATLDGASRPGHFDGVATVVAKLWNQAGACRSYFGEKDFQQLAVVRRLAQDLSFPVEVIGCPTVRAADGLALSSRNAYLSPSERAVASTLWHALQAGAATATDAHAAGSAAAVAAKAAAHVMEEVVGEQPAFALDFAAAVDPDTLDSPTDVTAELRLLIAARLGRTRLIDNVGVRL